MGDLEKNSAETVMGLASKISGMGDLSQLSTFKTLGSIGSLSERMNPVPLCRKAYAKTL